MPKLPSFKSKLQNLPVKSKASLSTLCLPKSGPTTSITSTGSLVCLKIFAKELMKAVTGWLSGPIKSSKRVTGPCSKSTAPALLCPKKELLLQLTAKNMTYTPEQEEIMVVLTRKNFESNVAEKRDRYHKIARRFPILTPFAALARETD